MRTPWGRKRARLEYLERIVAARVQLFDVDGEELLGTTVEQLYLAAKYGHGGQILEEEEEMLQFVFTISP